METKKVKELVEKSTEQFQFEPRLKNALIRSFLQIYSFLEKNPEYSTRRDADLQEEETIFEISNKYFTSFCQRIVIEEPKTISDPIVYAILQEVKGYSCEELKKVEEYHKMAMASENAVGSLLERFLFSVLSPLGWHWCCGNIVRSIDFIKRENREWTLLQIKNRDNSENSSSKKVREGTTIRMWFRSFSKKEGQNWENFPVSAEGLDEENFSIFIKNIISPENFPLFLKPSQTSRALHSFPLRSKTLFSMQCRLFWRSEKSDSFRFGVLARSLEV